MAENKNRSMVRRSGGAVEKATPRTKRILSGIAADTLALARKARPIRIVMVNDELGPLQALDIVIRHWFKDVTILFFENGATALKQLLQTDPDLLITDEIMPIMGGRELCQRLFDRRVLYPIIVNSPWDPTEEWVRALADLGFNISFLASPFQIESLLKAVETALKISRNPQPAKIFRPIK
jgi:DNA-binding NtrC family response regulator